MKSITAMLAVAALFLPGGVAAQSPAPAPVSPTEGTVFVQVGRLLADPATGAVQRDKTLVIRGNQIAEVRDGFVGEGQIVDLRDSFVLPGLIDSHVHLTGQQNPNSRLEEVTQSSAELAMVGAATPGGRCSPASPPWLTWAGATRRCSPCAMPSGAATCPDRG